MSPFLLSAALLIGAPAPPFASLATAPPSRGSSAPFPADDDLKVTQHEIKTGGKTLSYTVTTGMMPLKSDSGETEARIFYMAYTLNGGLTGTKRPLMFSFNGGPGSASVWLHMGAIGPKRVKMLDDGNLPPAPYQLEDNQQTWLDQTDLVFIDPVGTGYSRAAKPEIAKKYFGVQGDIESVGEFIRLYLGKNQRWTSPLFLVGESYGTTRAAGLSGYLIEKGIALNGILLISTVLQFNTVDFTKNNDLPFILFLPTYAATAWYHKKLNGELQRDLKKTLAEVEKWALTDYAAALAKGDAMSPSERQAVVEKLARYTGLDRRYIDNNNLRVEIFHFCKELLRDQNRTVGRLDSRIKGRDLSAASEEPDFDPSMTAIRPPYTALFNEYVRKDLGYISDQEYFILGGGIGRWDWGVEGRGGSPETADSLRSAFAKNPYMKLFVAYGYYDFATPYFAAKYTLNHLGLDAAQRENITTSDYEAGHMMYIHRPSLEKLKADAAAFIQSAVNGKAR